MKRLTPTQGLNPEAAYFKQMRLNSEAAAKYDRIVKVVDAWSNELITDREAKDRITLIITDVRRRGG